MHRYGHSSDHREDRTQILIGLVTDAEGLPITLHILRGNRTSNLRHQFFQSFSITLHILHDNRTSVASLVPCLRRMARRFDLTHITIVNDNSFPRSGD